MIPVLSDDTDDPAFIDLTTRAFNGAAVLLTASFLHLVKVDGWFGDRWYAFGGKVMGAFGVQSYDLKVPPFHPHRVLMEARFSTFEPFRQVKAEPLHNRRSGEATLKNPIRRLGDSIVIGWYSATSGRGSLMTYASTPHGPLGWYIGLERRADWHPVTLLGIDSRRWEETLRAGRGRAGLAEGT